MVKPNRFATLFFHSWLVISQVTAYPALSNDPIYSPSANSLFDGPRALDSSTFDWWYFDAVNQEGTSSITVVFYRGADYNPYPSFDYVTVSVVRPDGGSFHVNLAANSANVSTQGHGANGVWDGSGCSFEGTPDLSVYTINVNNNMIQGSLTIRSTAPAHFPDGSPPGTDSSTLVAPDIHWTTAIPAGIADCEFIMYGERFEFQGGVGYHDRNWGGYQSDTGVRSWYWGHAAVGTHSFVWFDCVTGMNERYSSSHLVENGNMRLTSQSTPSAVTHSSSVLPFHGDSATKNPDLPDGFTIHFVDSSGHWSFTAENVHMAENDFGALNYTRWIGTVKGGEVGKEIAIGSGVWEWLRF
jgi:hypothetical protein